MCIIIIIIVSGSSSISNISISTVKPVRFSYL